MREQEWKAVLIDRIRGGDLAVLDQVFEDNRKAFIAQLIKTTNCPLEEAKDFYAVAITIFYDNIMAGKLQRLTVKPLSYLLGVGQNLVSEWRRKNKNTPLDMDGVLLQHIVAEKPAEDQYEKKLALVLQQLEKLGKVCQAILELFYFEKRSIPEITILLDFANDATTKSRKYKCNQRLKKLTKSAWEKSNKL